MVRRAGQRVFRGVHDRRGEAFALGYLAGPAMQHVEHAFVRCVVRAGHRVAHLVSRLGSVCCIVSVIP